MNAATVIIGLVVLALLLFSMRGAYKHFKGEGSCCGGGDAVALPKKELKGKIVGVKLIGVSGMTCGHCKQRVEAALNNIEGAAAEVNLRRKEARLEMTREVTDDEIREALRDSGYEITGIENK